MKILNLDNWCDEATAIVREVAEVTTEGRHDCINTVGLISRLPWAVDKSLIDDCPNLKFVASCTTGLDHIDTDYCKAKGIEVISLQGETDFLQDVWATSEHTWALIMSLVRKVPWSFDDVKQGNWDREQWQGTELRGKTLGIVGYGRVGRQVAKFAIAFGMDVIFADPNIKQSDCNIYLNDWDADTLMADAEKKSLDYILQNSDIITAHVPLNAETKGMFGIEQFQQMKPTAYFVNTSRGAVVQEGALLGALMDKKIAGAALDVVNNEHAGELVECDDPGRYMVYTLWDYMKSHNNLIITPHIAGNTAESRRKTQLFIASKIANYIRESAK